MIGLKVFKVLTLQFYILTLRFVILGELSLRLELLFRCNILPFATILGKILLR